jgi:hypothetical protein
MTRDEKIALLQLDTPTDLTDEQIDTMFDGLVSRTRDAKLRDLEKWWSEYSIEVQPNVRLAIDKASIGANGVAALIAVQTQTDALLATTEGTVIVPATDVIGVMTVFQNGLKSVLLKRRELAESIHAAKTIDEINTTNW